MSYELQALIGTLELLTVAAAEVPVARVVPLAQGLAMLPVTSAVLAALQGDGATARTPAGTGFGRHADGFELRLAAWSKAGPIACVEAEGLGDGGTRRAAVWSDGRIVLGPLAEGEQVEGDTSGSELRGGGPESATAGDDPISRALRLLGARVAAGRADEFESVGLSAHRSTTGWAAAVG
ncbi:hypothetical protein ACPC54_13140 [Kitasatospora sp. NPDC094028]